MGAKHPKSLTRYKRDQIKKKKNFNIHLFQITFEN